MATIFESLQDSLKRKVLISSRTHFNALNEANIPCSLIKVVNRKDFKSG